MKRSKEEAERWLKQAEFDLHSAKKNYEQKIYSYTCFLCEQSAQKALKAYLFFKGERYVLEHSIKKLVENCSKFDAEFSLFEKHGAKLDKYYLSTRYPDALPFPAIPYESYTEEDAQEAIKLASEILNFVKNKIEIKAGKCNNSLY